MGCKTCDFIWEINGLLNEKLREVTRDSDNWEAEARCARIMADAKASKIIKDLKRQNLELLQGGKRG